MNQAAKEHEQAAKAAAEARTQEAAQLQAQREEERKGTQLLIEAEKLRELRRSNDLRILGY